MKLVFQEAARKDEGANISVERQVNATRPVLLHIITSRNNFPIIFLCAYIMV